MYFQKLENLSKIPDYKGLYLTVGALDQWLAFMPKSYRDRITPELFANKEGVDYGITYDIFNKLVELNMIKERYVLSCSCGNIIEFKETEQDMINFLIEYNEGEYTCNSCEQFRPLTTNNVFIIYKLMDEPRISQIAKKKISGFNCIDQTIKRRSLSDKILNNARYYAENYGIDKIQKIGTPEVSKAVNYILSND